MALVATAGCWFVDPDRTDEPSTQSPEPNRTTAHSPTETPPSTKTPVPEIVSRWGERFDSIVDVIELGVDSDGEERIDDQLMAAIDDDTLLHFPEGQYRLGPIDISGVENVGFVSLSDDVTRLTPAEPSESMDNFIDIWDASEVVLEGLEFDFTERGYGGAIRLRAAGDFVARDLRIRGRLPDLNKEKNHVGFRFDVQDPDSEGLVERIVARDGGHEGGNGVGIFVGYDHAGTLTFKDCEIANFPNNGLYASDPGRESDVDRGGDGAVHVVGGRYENNNIANVRIGTTASTVRDVTVVVDEVPPSPSERTLNVRGIRLRSQSDQLVENCEIIIGRNAGEGFGAISCHPDHGSTTVRNTRITVDRDDYNAIHAADADDGGSREPLEFENVTISGVASGGPAVTIADRPGTTFRECTIEQSGADRAGIRLENCDDCRIVESRINVTGDPIQAINSTIERVNLTTGQPAPHDGV